MVITKIGRFWLYGFGHRKTTASFEVVVLNVWPFRYALIFFDVLLNLSSEFFKGKIRMNRNNIGIRRYTISIHEIPNLLSSSSMAF